MAFQDAMGISRPRRSASAELAWAPERRTTDPDRNHLAEAQVPPASGTAAASSWVHLVVRDILTALEMGVEQLLRHARCTSAP
jgi:hypothetical protein